jgi:hypothetical protein
MASQIMDAFLLRMRSHIWNKIISSPFVHLKRQFLAIFDFFMESVNLKLSFSSSKFAHGRF